MLKRVWHFFFCIWSSWEDESKEDFWGSRFQLRRCIYCNKGERRRY